MTTVENKKRIQASVNEVYSFIEDCNNHEQLQPENIQNWQSTKDDVSFKIPNMGTFALKIGQRKPNLEIVLISKENTPVDLSIVWKLKPIDKETEVTLSIQAELNMMLKMIAMKPLQNLINFQLSKLKENFAK